MNEEPLESPVPDREPELKDAGQNPEKKSIAENTCEAALAPESWEDAGQNPEKSNAENTSEAATAPESLKDAGRNPEKKSNAENISEAAPAPESSACLDLSEPKKKPTSDTAEEISGETKEDAKSTAGEPPVDWFEPLEDDDEANSDGELESLAGESERSEVMASGEKTVKKMHKIHLPRRKRSHPDEGWSEWPMLGEGWKRKEVVRRSGSSIGQKDVYYLSPRGDRVRSRVELTTVLVGQLDLSNFDYKSGKFYDGEAAPVRVRQRAKRKIRERSSSESSLVDKREGADTPDSYHRLTPSLVPKNLHVTPNQTSVSSQSVSLTTAKVAYRDPVEVKIKLPPPSSSSKPLKLPSINGEIGSEENTLVCARCGISFTGTWYDKQRKRPFCPTCWASKTIEHPMIRFRKWIPCGQCVGCHNTVNCGQCANCKHGLQSPESRRRLCRKRKCICPFRKGPGGGGGGGGGGGNVSGSLLSQRSYDDFPETFDDSMSFQSEVTDSQHPSLKSSDTENFSVNVDVDDDDDMSTDDDDDWHKKRKRRSCGECKACLCRKDCGTCDFCIDKPKFGGSNKKRQKCRLRQCQRQAMRHLLPFQMGQGDFGADGTMLPGRPRPHYTYSRKSSFKKGKGPQLGYDLSDDDDDSFQSMSWSSEPASSKHSYEQNLRNNHSSMQLNYSEVGQRNGLPDRIPHISNHNNSGLVPVNRWDREERPAGRHGQKHGDHDDDDDDEEEEEEEEEEEDFPMITQICSLADNTAGSGADMENQLMKLLHSLRTSVLPILWSAIMVEGPQLQLIQCSKQSSMTDTMVLIDPDFCYQVTVQKQPLLPTHPLYDCYPTHLSSLTEVVNLLLRLEQYVVCRGLPPKDPSSNKDPLILERASTCDFLVRKNVSICANCRALQGL
ncbi:methyl-CpG-binding domain protein 1b isoform X2 [Labrus mixtus]|uniref:methyl-CpG-binding domain protein 1b isoform X2 n=1 Tax=Labrus mixtus TaxID=508554 RepID=UPI0029C06C0C|nr:methyl-CpG-binding domain protein 1b isoform X2 [Labrus mixtus]